jgi:acetylornithine deacetylase/succinyl-diaminopimelate desuccinylase-like protein
MASTVASLMPQLKSDLARLVAIPSISAPNYPEETRSSLLEAYDAVAELFRDAGVDVLDPLVLPNTSPVVPGEIASPRGAPTVLIEGMEEDAEMLLLGTTDGFANIHAPNERVLLDEFEKAVIAEADFFGRYAASRERVA